MTDRTNGNGRDTTMANGGVNAGQNMAAGAGGSAGSKRSCKNRWGRAILYTALAAIGLGAVLSGVGGLLGGFRQLYGLDIKGLTGIPFVYNGHAFGFAFVPRFGDVDADDQYDGWSRLEHVVGEDDDAMGGVRLDLTADTLRELYLDTDGCRVVVEESADDHVRLSVEGDTEMFRYLAENGALRIANVSERFTVLTGTTGTIRIRLPRGTDLNYLSAEVGAGEIECGRLTVGDADIAVGAGRCSVDRIAAQGAVTLSVGAGEIDLGSLVCREADISVDMGDLEIGDMTATDAEIELDMGDVNLDGEISGDLEVNCSMGDVNLMLRGAPEAHNYEIDGSMGTISLDGIDYAGLTSQRSVDNGADSDYSIDCSMGTVNIAFMQ